jgi:hypothetical protein
MQRAGYSLRHLNPAVLVIGFLLLVPTTARAQTTFTNVTDLSSTPLTFAAWSASWVDYDGDGREDLFLSRSSGGGLLLQNTGSGFEPASDTGMEDAPGVLGHTWADMDNDGDLDLFTAGSRSVLFRSNGDGTFTTVDSGDISDRSGNSGWSASWGDYDNDGWLDLIVANPVGFVGSHPNRLFHGDGNGNFSSVTSGPVVDGTDTYTIPTWADFDMDGDLDLFIGSGPANGDRDTNYLYRNLLTDAGQAEFEYITGINIADDTGDGQVMNWIDIDNDGDLDLCVTNYRGRGDESQTENPNGLGLAPYLYRNNGDNSYTRNTRALSFGEGGSSGQDLANVWGDVDNDGDLDVLIATSRITAGSGLDRLYLNNGKGSFSLNRSGELGSALNTSSGAAFGDYDNDGDLDLIVTGISPSTPNNRIYRNDLDNENGWLKLRLEGTISNRSAIGAVLIADAMIGGEAVTMVRQVSAQNTFGGQNSLVVHFGLGDASYIDALTIRWPSGQVDRIEDVAPNQAVNVVEGQAFTGAVVSTASEHEPSGTFRLTGAYPNPAASRTRISFDLPHPAYVGIEIYDVLGRRVAAVPATLTDAGPSRSITVDAGSLTNGSYIYRLTGTFGREQKQVSGSLIVAR